MITGERLAALFWRTYTRRREPSERFASFAALFWRSYNASRVPGVYRLAAGASASVILAASAGVVLGRGQTGPALPTVRTVVIAARTPIPASAPPSNPVVRALPAAPPPPPTAAPTVAPLVALHDMLISAPAGYFPEDPISIGPDDAARMGSDPDRERAALLRSGFRAGVLRRFMSSSGDDQLAALGYEFADDGAADAYLAHAVEDFKHNVNGAASFDTGVARSAGFVSEASNSHFVFVYVAKGRFVFAITSGGRSAAHNAEEGRTLARAQHDRA